VPGRRATQGLSGIDLKNFVKDKLNGAFDEGGRALTRLLSRRPALRPSRRTSRQPDGAA